MIRIKAEVKNGRIVADVPTDLPDGTVVELVRVDDDPYAYLDEQDEPEMDDEERAKLDDALERGAAEIQAGLVIPADEVLAELRKL